MTTFSRRRRWTAILATAVLGTGCAAPSPDASPYLDAARDAGRWLRSVAVDGADGRRWPIVPGPEAEGDPSVDHLYHGNSGVVLFFLELARRTGDTSWLDDARCGADHLAAALPEHLAADDAAAGLYVGVPGPGFVLEHVARATGEPRYRLAARRAAELVKEAAVPSGVGVAWGEVNDIVAGTAGTGLYLLWAGEAFDDPEAVELAEAAGHRLLELAESTEHGLDWPLDPDYPLRLPNFSHGTAGVAYFLASLYLETGDRRFLDGAVAGARHVTGVADVTETYCLVPHHLPGGEDLHYLSWCHGPAGTGRLFARLHQATGDAEWLEWLERAVQGVVASGIPEQRTPGFWDNVGQCCGSAGVAQFLLGVDRLSGIARHRELVRRLADDVLARATRTADGLHWVHAEHRKQPGLRLAQTGYMQGAAGMGILLLDLDAALGGGAPGIALPDSPFGD